MTFFSGINKSINKSNIGVGGGGVVAGGTRPPNNLGGGGGGQHTLWPIPPIIHSSLRSISM